MNTKKRCSIVVLLMFVGIFYFTTAVLPENAKATVLFVGGTGLGNYTTIQDAIDDAEPGDIVYVSSGEYFEHLTIDKPLTLIGEDRSSTSINGEKTGDVVIVNADWVNITEITILESGSYEGDAGIKLFDSNQCFIANTTLLGNRIGLVLESSSNNTLLNISASNNGDGISLFDSYSNSIIGSVVSLNIWYGILLEQSSYNIIVDSLALNNTYGIAMQYFSSHNSLESISASGNYHGISSLLSNGTIVSNGSFSHNRIGINLENCNNNTVVNNTVSSNSRYGLRLRLSDDNLVYHNTLVENEIQAIDDGDRNQWDNGYPSGGNFWSDYDGIDNKRGPVQNQPGSDGIGDTPYDIYGGESKDRYPFFSPNKKSNSEQVLLWVTGTILTVVILIIIVFIMHKKKGKKDIRGNSEK